MDNRGAQKPEAVFLSATMTRVFPKSTIVRPDGEPDKVTAWIPNRYSHEGRVQGSRRKNKRTYGARNISRDHLRSSYGNLGATVGLHS